MRYRVVEEGPFIDCPPKLNRRFARFETYLVTRWGLDSISASPVLDALYGAMQSTGQVRPRKQRKAKPLPVAKEGKLIVYDFAPKGDTPDAS